MTNNPYQQLPPQIDQRQLSKEQVSSKVLPPGIALIAIGALGFLVMGAYGVLSIIGFAAGSAEMPPKMRNEPGAEVGYYVGLYGSLITIFINFFSQIFIILGGISMVRMKGYCLAFTGAILSVIPCIGSSVCLLGIPFGIWSLIVLSDPNVKRAFR